MKALLLLAFTLLGCQPTPHIEAIRTHTQCADICYAEHQRSAVAYYACLKKCQHDNKLESPPILEPKSCWARCHDECPADRRALCVSMCGRGHCHPSQCGDC